MNDQEPTYFTEFKNDFKDFRGQFTVFEKYVREKLDTHEEQIAEVTEQLTMLSQQLKGKADKEDLLNFKRRVVQLESKHI